MKIVLLISGLLLTGCTAYTPIGAYDYRPVVRAPVIYAPAPVYGYLRHFYDYRGHHHGHHGHHD